MIRFLVIEILIGLYFRLCCDRRMKFLGDLPNCEENTRVFSDCARSGVSPGRRGQRKLMDDSLIAPGLAIAYY